MKRKPAKPRKQPSITPVRPGEAPPDSDTVRYLEVAGHWIPLSVEKPVTFRDLDGSTYRTTMPRHLTAVDGIDLPKDLGKAIDKEGRRYVAELARYVAGWMRIYRSGSPYYQRSQPGTNRMEDPMRDLQIPAMRAIHDAVQAGFYLALLRYADDLKSSAEAGPILERMKEGRKKGGAAARKKAEPSKMESRRMFRELRRSGFSPDHARQEISMKRRISKRTVERHTKGLS